MQLQWYPGHMTRARRMMQENLKWIDLILELSDARIPASGRNPDIDALAGGKARLLLLNKADMANPQWTQEWKAYYEARGLLVLALDARKKEAMKDVRRLVESACAGKREKESKKGILCRPLRAMVCGIPNVGKSTFINTFAGRAGTKTGNTPGVTRGKQWIRLGKDLELLDTPGILWPKFEDKDVAFRLAAIGTIREEILPQEALALALIRYLQETWPGALAGRYRLPGEEKEDHALLQAIGRARGCLAAGGAVDEAKAAKALLEDFKSGRLGRISLERA